MSHSKLFLSYARAESLPFVQRLYERPVECGFATWWDKASMPSRALTFRVRPADRVIDGYGLIPPKGGHHHGPRQSAGRREGTSVATLDR